MKYIHRKSKDTEIKDDQDLELLLLSKTLQPPSPKDEEAYRKYKEKCAQRAKRPDPQEKAWQHKDYQGLMPPKKIEKTL